MRVRERKSKKCVHQLARFNSRAGLTGEKEQKKKKGEKEEMALSDRGPEPSPTWLWKNSHKKEKLTKKESRFSRREDTDLTDLASGKGERAGSGSPGGELLGEEKNSL